MDPGDVAGEIWELRSVCVDRWRVGENGRRRSGGVVWYFGWGGIQGVGFIWVSVAALGFAPPSTLSSCISPFLIFGPA